MRQARQLLKQYNNAFAFVSYGMHCFKDMHSGRGPPVTICHGTVYHSSGFLFPDEGEAGEYAQVYLYDHNAATQARETNVWNQGLDKGLLRQLQSMMDRVSPYVQAYHTMRDLALHVWPQQPPETVMVIEETAGNDMRRYNKPKQLEPAVVFRSHNGTPPTDRDIAVWPRDPTYNTYRISDKCEHVDPLAYPLLFPHGELGWHPHLQHAGRRTAANTRLTSIQFYAYRLMLRDYEPDEGEEAPFWAFNQPSLPHSGGMLFQQWICDAYSRAEAQRLVWVVMNQDKLRAETYQGLVDAVNDPSFKPGASKVGSKIILPATYPGSPRAMQQN